MSLNFFHRLSFIKHKVCGSSQPHQMDLQEPQCIPIPSDSDGENEKDPVKRQAKKGGKVTCNYDKNDLSVVDLTGDDEIFPISDEKYAEELQLQEALTFSLASLMPSSSSNQNASSSEQPLMTSAEASKSPAYSFCAICMDTKTAFEMFENTNVCRHLFCHDCIRGHVAAKIQENRAMVKCPDPNCKGVIGPEACRYIIPNEVLARWEYILCESMITESDKFYCPFEDCSAMLVNDGGATVTSSECPNCNRLFCAQCKVAWHCEMNCVEFQSLKKGKGSEKLLMDLANKQKWTKCSKCNFYVEKVDGCNYISCRCGHKFCYRCGKPSDHSGRCCSAGLWGG